MRGVHRKFVLALLLMFKYVAAGTEADDFLDVLDRQVKAIAQQAANNAQQACDLVDSCKEASSCSRGECAPLTGERFDCVRFDQTAFPYCSGCNSEIMVTDENSFVRTPYFVTQGQGDLADVLNSVCVQRMLDETFRNVANEQRLKNPTIFVQFYFGSADGVFRYYPGREIFNCTDLYDPRVRPWYTGAIAVAKDLVLLLDNGNSMQNSANKLTRKSAFDYAKEVGEQLLYAALTEPDHLTIVTFNSTNTTTIFQVDVSEEDTSKQDALDALKEANIYGTGTPSDVVGALESVITTLNKTQASGNDKLKIVVLFTDGSSQPDPANLDALLDQLQQQNIFLFTYIIGTAKNFTCSGARYAHFESLNLVSLDHPLQGLKSYLSFQARSRQQVNNNTVFWQGVYPSASGLGDVLTVAYPAIYNGQLVGVAGIDVQKLGLGAQLQSDIANSLKSDARQVNPKNPGGDRTVLLCQESQQFQNCSVKPPINSICQKNATLVLPTDIICCKICGGPALSSGSGSGSSSNTTKVVIISVVAGVAALAFIVAGVIALLRRKRSEGPFKTPPPNPSSVNIGGSSPLGSSSPVPLTGNRDSRYL